MFKKFIAYLLTVSVLLSMLVVNVSAADEGISAERVTKFENAVTLLTKIGAISEEDAFEFDTGISKGKFVDIMSKVVPVSDGAATPVFADVAADHEYFKVIQGFADAGYVYGNGGFFEPDRDITYNEALYIVLHTMGYKEFMNLVGAFPTGGWQVASQLNIKMRNKSAIAGDIFYMLYQALTTDMLEIAGMSKDAFIFSNVEGETLLEKYFDITDKKGTLQSNGYISLIGGYDPEVGVIVIDGVSYSTEEACDILPGCTVDLYYDEETNEPVCVIASDENEIFEINSFDLEGFMDNKYSYKVDGSKKTVKIDDKTTIVKNGVLVTEVPNEAFMEPVNGKVILVNDGRGSGYDVAYIKDYISFVVKAVESDNTTVTIKADSRYKIPNVVANLLNDVAAVYDDEGNSVAAEDIAIGTVISVMGNLVGEVIVAEEIVTSDSIVTGTLTTIRKGDDPTLVIDDEEYRVAEAAGYDYAATFLNTISPQMDMTFFVDFMGNIVALDDSISGSMAYGYLIGAKMGENDDGDVCIVAEIFSEIGSIIKYNVSTKRVTIDGKSYSGKNIEEAAWENVYLPMFLAAKDKLVRYDVNNDRELSKIDTPKSITDTSGPEPTVDDRLYLSVDNLTGKIESTFTQYYGSKKAFGDKVHVDEDTLIFKLPDIEEDGEDSEYKIIRSIGGLKDGRYGVVAYKLGTDMLYAKVVVLRELLDPGLSADHIGNMMVTKVTQVLDEYGEPTYSVTLLGLNGEKTYFTKNERVAQYPVDLSNNPTAYAADGSTAAARIIVPGDIVRCYLTEDEKYIAQIAVCYDIRKGNMPSKNGADNWVSDNGTIGDGYVYAIDDKRIGIATGEPPLDVMTVLEDSKYSTYMLDSYKIFKVETTGKGSDIQAREVVPASKSDIKSFKINGRNCSKVVAISSRGTGQMMFIFDSDWDK